MFILSRSPRRLGKALVNTQNMHLLLVIMRRSVIVVKDDKYKRTLGSYFYIFNSIMTKLFVLPLMLAATAGIIGSTPVEAGPGGGSFISSPKRCTRKNPCSRMPELPSPRKRCGSRKNPCSPMPELPFFPGEIQPMPRGGLQPYPGTQWRR